MERSLHLRDLTISPPRLLAPMAGITHSAFRRLVAGFGGCGAMCTEMLPVRTLLRDDLGRSPFTKRRPEEGLVVYQLMVGGPDGIGEAVARLKTFGVAAIDINLGCPAPQVVRRKAGAALFSDLEQLDKVLDAVRACWDGALTVKCRLGDETPAWRDEFVTRLRVFEHHAIDAVILHPRFFKEKLKRVARADEWAWAAAQTRLPVVANGDLTSAADPAGSDAAGVMIGRMAIVKPWLFAEPLAPPPAVDYAEVWTTFYQYVNEDFRPERALGRIKEFTGYFARNFFFGHELFRAVQGASSLAAAHDRALCFLRASPKTVTVPSVAGV